MCGIAGYVAETLPPGANRWVDRMVNSLARRGPDGQGMECWPAAVLGHRRLSIFDLSDAARQPMRSDDGEIGVVFNGAIYNFLDIRAELESKGCRFRSRCDTEVLLHGYRMWGIDALLPRLRGMFAIAIWDNPRCRLTLVRDRLGVKPLVYAIRNRGLAFASTARALRDAGFTGEIDATSMLGFLDRGWVASDRSIYKGISKLPAGTILEWHAGHISQREYWNPPDAPSGGSFRFEEAVQQTEDALLESVRIRLFADVPVGALLSGGMDSALVCWALTKLNSSTKAFTAYIPGDPSDESEDARQTARVLGIPHEVVEVSGSDGAALESLTAAHDEPFACSSALGMLEIAKVLNPCMKVLLTGDGGDDVFLGYPRHLTCWWAQKSARAIPRTAASAWPLLRPAVRLCPPLRRVMHFTDYATGGMGPLLRVADGLAYYRDHQLLGERLQRLSVSDRDVPASLDSARRLLTDYLKYERRTRFLSEYLPKIDSTTMYHGMEARSPFLDHRLWELAAALPYQIRLHGGERKAILRALVRKHIGVKSSRRRKRGFTVPAERWLMGPWRRQISDLVQPDSLLESQGWLNRGAFLAAWKRSFENNRAPSQLWHLVVLENWLRYEQKAAPDRSIGGARSMAIA